MAAPEPIYNVDNCSFSYPLQWSLTAFWRTPTSEANWLEELRSETEKDGIRLLGHRFAEPGTSQFTISSQPHVAPRLIVQRVKGRLQYLIRDTMREPWRRHFAIRSVGRVTRADVEKYVILQLDHHRMADSKVQNQLGQFQINRPEVDLSRPQRTSHGRFWYNLHVVLVHRERFVDIRTDILRPVREMVVQASASKGYLLSCAAILPDHVHLTLGCPFDVAPADVAIGFLNNLSFAHGMKAVFQYGAFIGTIGEYTNCALNSDLSSAAPRFGCDQRSTETSSGGGQTRE